METRLRTLRLSDEAWERCRQKAEIFGYESRTALILAWIMEPLVEEKLHIEPGIGGTVNTTKKTVFTPVYTAPNETIEPEYEKDFDWGA